jgi:hypothetical protein
VVRRGLQRTTGGFDIAQWGTVTSGVGDDPLRLVLGNLDADDDLDVVILSDTDNAIVVRLDNGQGVLTAGIASFPMSGGVEHVALADLNGDDDLDVMDVDRDADVVSIRSGDGTGRFGGRTTYTTRDGLPDIVTANLVADSISIIVNFGEGGPSGPRGSGVLEHAAEPRDRQAE